MSSDEEIKKVRELHLLMGVNESYEAAKREWDQMLPWEQETALALHAVFFETGDELAARVKT